MTHDPLCPCNESGHTHYEYAPSRLCTYCRCALIAKVRQDERSRHQGQSVMLTADADAAIAAAEADVLAKCIAAVEYLHDHEAPHDAHRDALWNAVTALRALQEKPEVMPLTVPKS
jgi:hypothetical protein